MAKSKHAMLSRARTSAILQYTMLATISKPVKSVAKSCQTQRALMHIHINTQLAGRT